MAKQSSDSPGSSPKPASSTFASDFTLTSIATTNNAISTPRHELSLPFFPYDLTSTKHNKNRLEIEDIVERFKLDESSVTKEELERLKEPIPDWDYNEKVSSKNKKKNAAILKKLNQDRERILKMTMEKYSPNPPVVVGIPLRKEILGKSKKNSDHHQDQQKMNSLQMTHKPKKNNPFIENYGHVVAKVDTGLGHVVIKTPLHGGSQKTGLSSFPDRQGVKESQEKDKPSFALKSLQQILPHSSRDNKAKCTTNEAVDYFMQVAENVNRLEDCWILRVAKGSTIMEMDTIVPPEQILAMTNLNQKQEKSIIDANNNVLLDVMTNCFLESCQTVFEKNRYQDRQTSTDEKLVDVSNVVDEIVQTFMTRLINGIFLPPLPLLPNKNSNNEKQQKKKKSKTIITMDAIPEKLRVGIYYSFIGKGLKDNWRVYDRFIISYQDAMGFLPGKNLKANPYNALLTKLKDTRSNPSSSIGQLILWDEIQSLMKEHPDLNGVQVKNSSVLESFQKQLFYNSDKTAEYIFISINPEEESVQSGILIFTPPIHRLEIYIPEQPNIPFWQWVGDSIERVNFGLCMAYIKTLLQKMYDVQGDWWIEDGEEEEEQVRKPLSRAFRKFPESWPWNSKFVISNRLEASNSLSLSRIYCAVFFEMMTNREKFEQQALPFIDENSVDDLEQGDARFIYFKLLQEMKEN